MRQIDLVVLHCSASESGDTAIIDRWHRERGFRGIGYHYVVLNGYRTAEMHRCRTPDCVDGEVEKGRGENEVGAHVAGFNTNSIGICLIGNNSFSDRQMAAARKLVVHLLAQYPEAKLVGHCELDAGKTCPNLDMNLLRSQWRIADLKMEGET